MILGDFETACLEELVFVIPSGVRSYTQEKTSQIGKPIARIISMVFTQIGWRRKSIQNKGSNLGKNPGANQIGQSCLKYMSLFKLSYVFFYIHLRDYLLNTASNNPETCVLFVRCVIQPDDYCYNTLNPGAISRALTVLLGKWRRLLLFKSQVFFLGFLKHFLEFRIISCRVQIGIRGH